MKLLYAPFPSPLAASAWQWCVYSAPRPSARSRQRWLAVGPEWPHMLCASGIPRSGMVEQLIIREPSLHFVLWHHYDIIDMVMMSLWYCYDIIEILLWHHYAIIVILLCHHCDIVMMSLWYCMTSLWYCLTSLWNCYDVIVISWLDAIYCDSYYVIDHHYYAMMSLWCHPDHYGRTRRIMEVCKYGTI